MAAITEIMDGKIAQFSLEIEIGGDVKKTWRALTEQIDEWWLPDFREAGEGSVVSLDTGAGGHLVERTPDGTSLLWYTVLRSQPEKVIELYGASSPDWGGPSLSFLKLELVPNDAGCVLQITVTLSGRVTDLLQQNLNEGWQQLFGEGLKNFVEK